MVCNRCIMVVRQEFEKLGIKPVRVELGFVETDRPPTPGQMTQLDASLKALGFEILDDARKIIIERIKTGLIALIREEAIDEHFSLVSYLSDYMHKEYSTLSKLFSAVESITIEQFFILQKIEKVKELLVYNELSLSEISYRLGYSSVAYLSSQFKKVTGQTPSRFRQNHDGKRKPLDTLKQPFNKV